MYPKVMKTTNEFRTVVVYFTAPKTGMVLFCTDGEYDIGERNEWVEAQFDQAGFDDMKVRLVNGDVVILDYEAGTKNREEGYHSRCHSHRFTMLGNSTCRAKYNIAGILGEVTLHKYMDPNADANAALAKIEEMTNGK